MRVRAMVEQTRESVADERWTKHGEGVVAVRVRVKYKMSERDQQAVPK